ncbi:unnamed protein product, partial [Nesidiocoris tenuis]
AFPENAKSLQMILEALTIRREEEGVERWYTTKLVYNFKEPNKFFGEIGPQRPTRLVYWLNSWHPRERIFAENYFIQLQEYLKNNSLNSVKKFATCQLKCSTIRFTMSWSSLLGGINLIPAPVMKNSSSHARLRWLENATGTDLTNAMQIFEASDNFSRTVHPRRMEISLSQTKPKNNRRDTSFPSLHVKNHSFFFFFRPMSPNMMNLDPGDKTDMGRGETSIRVTEKEGITMLCCDEVNVQEGGLLRRPGWPKSAIAVLIIRVNRHASFAIDTAR